MLDVNTHRLTASVGDPEKFSLNQPFSFFDFTESRFDGCDSIRRVFSLARAAAAESLLLEKISPVGVIAEENEDIALLHPSYHNAELLRLSFWNKAINCLGEIKNLDDQHLVGYAIFKRDQVPVDNLDEWHVFEAVIPKDLPPYHCVPRQQTFQVAIYDSYFSISGVLYCQQNGINKACAQVALRSLLSRILPEGDISYRRINELADKAGPGFDKGKGLAVPRIRAVLSALEVKFNDIDYRQYPPESRKDLPYQKYAYAGLESGAGALIGFKFAGKDVKNEPEQHIIPVFGHVFDKDTWAPDADTSYFHIGDDVWYIPSESWTSSFLGHDDNFGPNFSIPRLYIDVDKVEYVLEMFRPGVVYSGMKAEVFALQLLYSLSPEDTANDALWTADTISNKWVTRLYDWVRWQQVVFRAQAMSRTEYVEHLRSLHDWDGNKENPDICNLLASEMPSYVWAVEVSTPQLFPANERKLGEIVLDATKGNEFKDEMSGKDLFVFARLPGVYFLGGNVTDGSPELTPVPSRILSHTSLVCSRNKAA